MRLLTFVEVRDRVVCRGKLRQFRHQLGEYHELTDQSDDTGP